MKTLIHLIIAFGTMALSTDGTSAGNGVQNNEKEAVVVGDERVFSLPGGAQMAFVWIEPGTFQMGSPPSEASGLLKKLAGIGGNEGEGPVHAVTISEGFWLGKYEVTQGQWESVMGTTPWRGADNVDKDRVESASSHPAVYISWEDLQVFIERLNSASGEGLYRLPTEAEWEYSCRAGITTRWSFGDDEDQLIHYAWTRKNSWDRNERYAHAVGQKRPNPWGLNDMHGNVWEWVQDWYGGDYYTHALEVDPVGPTNGSKRVLRGGDFSDPVQYLRAAVRHQKPPDTRSPYYGARLLRIR